MSAASESEEDPLAGDDDNDASWLPPTATDEIASDSDDEVVVTREGAEEESEAAEEAEAAAAEESEAAAAEVSLGENSSSDDKVEEGGEEGEWQVEDDVAMQQEHGCHIYRGKNGTIWKSTPTVAPTARMPAINIFREKFEPSFMLRSRDVSSVFAAVVSPDVKDIIYRITNKKGKHYAREWNEKHLGSDRKWLDLTIDELNCFIGKLLACSLQEISSIVYNLLFFQVCCCMPE